MKQRGEEAEVSMTREGEFSRFPAQNDRIAPVSSIGSLLQLPTSCAKSLLSSRKGRDRK